MKLLLPISFLLRKLLLPHHNLLTGKEFINHAQENYSTQKDEATSSLKRANGILPMRMVKN
jgi:hypothetical protein